MDQQDKGAKTLQRLQIKFLSLILFLFLLSGCLYPQSELAKNQVPHEEQLAMVQQAVEQYRDDSGGLLPIKTKDSEVAIFEKYLIDFALLKDQNYIADIPGNAFENGGIYQYTIIYPEDDPQVKLIDLRLTEQLRQVNVKLDIYRSKNLYPPYGEQLTEDIYKLNYNKLGFKEEPIVTSPFSQVNLPLIMNTEGELFIDYRIDLNQALEEYDNLYKEGDDIRYLLPDHSPFVPAYSLPYTIENNEPVFLNN